MEKEKRELLFKDLCGRLPYGVIVEYCYKFEDVDKGGKRHILTGRMLDSYFYNITLGGTKVTSIKPYLRPMSSMAEEEKLELVTLYLARDKRCRKDLRIKETEFFLDSCWYVQIVYKDENDKEVISAVYIGRGSYVEEIDWLNAHHFDYRGLIEKGLAIEAPDGMYEN